MVYNFLFDAVNDTTYNKDKQPNGRKQDRTHIGIAGTWKELKSNCSNR